MAGGQTQAPQQRGNSANFCCYCCAFVGGHTLAFWNACSIYQEPLAYLFSCNICDRYRGDVSEFNWRSCACTFPSLISVTISIASLVLHYLSVKMNCNLYKYTFRQCFHFPHVILSGWWVWVCFKSQAWYSGHAGVCAGVCVCVWGSGAHLNMGLISNDTWTLFFLKVLVAI